MTSVAGVSRIRLLVIVRSLDPGGAERQLLTMMRCMDTRAFHVRVVCFYRGAWHSQLEAIEGVEARVVGKNGRFDFLGFVLRLYRSARDFRPDVIYGYMFVADLLALLLGRRVGACVVWGLRSSDLRQGSYGWLSEWVQWASRKLAHRADLVISNSRGGLDDFIARGARVRKSVVIPNGIDTDRFMPNPEARESMRRSWGLPETSRVIGLVARVDPMKGHFVFIEAASLLARAAPDVLFVCVGSHAPHHAGYAKELRERVAQQGLAARFRWIGHVDRTEFVYPALDVCTSASLYGEGFSNAVAEAMACGVPCVVSDVGDSAHIVGDRAYVFSPGNPEELCVGWMRVLSGRGGASFRERVVHNFSLERFAIDTDAAFRLVVNDPCSAISV